MPLLLWKKQYSVDVELFDNQHKQLFDLINDLIKSVKNDNEQESLEEAVNSLVQYTKEHFSIEEKNMEKYNYPDLESHCKEHSSLTEKVQDLTTQFKLGKIDPNKLIMFLMEWLAKHIMGCDKKYSEFFNGKEIIT